VVDFVFAFVVMVGGLNGSVFFDVFTELDAFFRGRAVEWARVELDALGAEFPEVF
jgi:hypothetical protein